MDRTIVVRLTASVSQYQASLGAAAAQTKAFGNEIATAAGQGNVAMQNLGKGMVVAGGLLAAGLGISVVKAMEFEREMRNVNSITKESEGAFAATSNQVLALSRTVPQSAATLAKGLYDIASSGFAGADGMKILEASAIAATAGMTTTDVSAQAITATLNAYGRQASDAGDISDVLFKTVEVGVITFEELASGMGDWVGMAAAAKVPVDEAAAAIAAMTLSGISAAEAGTSLNQVFRAIIDPSDALKNKLAELGYESGAQALETDGLRGVMEKLRTATGGNITELQALFPEIRGLRGVLALTANEGRNFGLTFDQITSAQQRAGAAQAAYNEQSKALSVQWELAKSSMTAFAIEVGNRLLPILSKGAELVGGLFTSFAALPGPVITGATALAGVAAVALTMGGALLVLAPRIAATNAALGQMGAAGALAQKGLGFLPGIAGGAAILLTLALSAQAVESSLEDMVQPRQDVDLLSESLAEFGRTGVTSGEMAKTFGANLENVVRAVRSTTDLTGWESFFTAPKLSDTQGLRDYDEALTAMVAGGKVDDAAAAFERITQRLLEQGVSVDRAREAFPQYAAASDAARVEADKLTQAASEEQKVIDNLGVQLGETTLKTDEQTEAQKLLEGVYKEVSTSIMGFTEPMDAYRSALEANTEAARLEGQAALDRATEVEGANATAGKSWEDYATVASVSLQQVLDELNKQDEAYNNWADNLSKIAARGRGDLAIELAKLGPEAAPLVQSFADGTGAIFNEAADAWILNTRRGQDGSAEAIVQGALVQQEFARQGANATVETVAAALGLLPPEVQRIVDETNANLQNGEPAWNQSWGNRTTISLEEMQRVASDAPPKVEEATNLINQHLIDTNPAFAEQFASRRGVSVEEMNGVLVDAPPLVREAADTINQHLADTQPLFAQNWGDRKTVSLAEMNQMLAEAPPIVRQATDTINQHLTDTNPAFAEQFQSRRGVSIDEMNTMLRDAPPVVQQAANLINQHMTDTKGRWDQEWIDRRVKAVTESETARNLAPPVVSAMARILNEALSEHKPGWDQQFDQRRQSAVDQTNVMRGQVPPIVGATGQDMNNALAGPLPGFRGTVGAYTSSLESGIRTVRFAGGPGTAEGNAARRAYQADGGIVEFYAQGGLKESHQAQIARAGDWRVWAEPETGGEAYIPLAAAKRARSTNILEDVAGRFGLVLRPAEEHEIYDYHSGGLYVPPPAPPFPNFGPPIRPAGFGSMEDARVNIAAIARAHMNEPHHQAPPPSPGGAGGGGGLSGGKALDRVNSILGGYPGARITSTYRSPSSNAAAGGARNSYHMDRANPAVDIGGPTSTLDLVAGRLRSMGGWREGPLWRVRGHYDHAHVANEGLVINSMQSFDKGGWLQPGMTLAHNGTGAPERVVTMKDGGLVGDTFYGDPGGYQAKQRRINDEEGAQFDYMNRRETRARRQERLDEPYPAPREPKELKSVDKLMPVPTSQSWDNSINVNLGGLKMDVRAEVGANVAGMQSTMTQSLERMFAQFTRQLQTEIRTRG